MASQYPFNSEYAKAMKSGKLASPPDVYYEGMDAEFFLPWAKWAYAMYCSNQTLLGNGGRLGQGRYVGELRDYARGVQSVDKYRLVLDKEIKNGQGASGGLLNISWDNTKFYNKVRSQIIDRIMERQHDPQVIAIDTAARYEKELQYAKDKLATDPRSKMMFQEVGVQPQGVSDAAYIMDSSDIDTLKAMGGYQFAAEVIMRDAVKATMDICDWENTVRHSMVEDLIDAGVCAMHICTEADGRQYVKYIDLPRLICRQSMRNDHQDIDFAGYVEGKTLAQVRQEGNLPEDVMVEIARKYRSSSGTDYSQYFEDDRSNGYREDYMKTGGHRPYDQMPVYTMTLYFIAAEAEHYVVGIHKSGGRIFDKVGPESKLKGNAIKAGKQIVTNTVQKVYKCTWIIGSDIVYNYGIDSTIVRTGRDGYKKAVLPICVYHINDTPITERVIPIIDDLEIAIKKKRIALAKMPPPPNMVMDMSLVQDGINLGGTQFSITDILDIYHITGVMYLESRSEFGLPGEGSNRPPMTPVPNTYIEHINAARQEVMDALQQMQQLAGLNDISDGTGRAADVLTTVAEGFETATNRALHPIYLGDSVQLRRMASMVVKKYQQSVLYGDIELIHIPVYDTTAQIILLDKKMSLHDFEVTIRRAPSPEDRQMLIAALTQNKQANQITDDGYFTVLNMIMRGDIQKAQFFLSKFVKAKQKTDAEMQQAAMQQQSQYQGQAAQVAADAEARTKMMESEGKAKLLELEHMLKMQENEQLHKHRLAEQTVKAQQQAVADSLKI